MTRCWHPLAVVAWLAMGIAAQPTADPRSELDRARAALLARGDALDQVLDQLILHHLGLDVQRERYLQPQAREDAPSHGALERALQEQRIAAGQAAAILAQREAAVARLRAGIPVLEPVQIAMSTEPGATTDVRAAAERIPLPAVALPAPPGAAAARQLPLADVLAAPLTEEATGVPVLVEPLEVADGLGRAYFRAGHYEHAAAALKKAVDVAEPSLMDQFLLARCYEQLGKQDQADGLFLQIEVADTSTGADGQQALGAWGLSARMARKHMAWMRTNRGWSISIPVRPKAGSR